jgi:uncharacterized membrane protein YgcG
VGTFPARSRLRKLPRGSGLLSLAALLALVTLLAGGLLLPARAMAEDPFRLASQIEDRAGALDGREGEVKAALEDLQDSERVQLWVAYVDTFSGVGAQDWANETAVESDLGLNDVLLAVAVEDRGYAYSVDEDFPLTNAQLNDIMTTAVEPALRKDDWAGAVVGAATGMKQALGGGVVTTAATTGSTGAQSGAAGDASEGGFPWGIVIGLIVLALIVLLILILVWRSRSGRAEKAAAPAPGADAAPPITLDELRRKASAELVETDDAVKTSADEVGFAAAEFGEVEAAPFQQAVDEARRELDEAFKLHKQYDESADEQVQRQLLTAVLQHTATANEKLDAQVERFDRLRDLETKAPEVLAALEQQLSGLEARVPQVRQELAALAAVYAPTALKAVASNPDEATSRIGFSREQVKAGRQDIDAGRRGEAAVAALAAQEAAGQAQAFLDAVGRLGKDLGEARERIEAAITETRRDIAEAQAAGAGAQLSPLITTAEAAVTAAASAASPEGGRDPLAALRHLEEADAALEKALQQVREEQAQRATAAAALDRTLLAARAEIAAADDYITTHRGAIGSGPRAQLAEAQRALDQAVALGVSDPVTAARSAASAHELAARTLSDAQTETEQAMSTSGMPNLGGGSTLIGAILGGILASGLGGGSSGGGFGGGVFGSGGRSFGGGGFAPPSFGGMGTRMRRGGGGRF